MPSSFRQSQAPTQQQPQRSQQSFSQGISSQHNAIFSQFSQNSQEETLTNDQLAVSQERENPVRRFSCLPSVNHSREESQMLTSRYSTNLMPKWSSAVPEPMCQMSKELEHRIGTIGTSLSRFTLMMESLQSDIMQINKGTKELAMEMESICQKLIVHENSLQLINKRQEDTKSSIDEGLKSISDKFSQDTCQQNSQEISLLLSSLPEKFGAFILNLRNDLSKTFTNEIKALACQLKEMDQKILKTTVPTPKAVSFCAPLAIVPQMNPAMPAKVQQATQTPKVEMGTWNSVKREQATLTNRDYSKGYKRNVVPQAEPERDWRIVIESDEEINGGFSFLFEEKETGSFTNEKAKEETERILRKARRRKRKHSNIIVIN